MAHRLDQVLAEVVSEDDLREIIREIVREAKSGTSISERRSARQVLFGLLGASTSTKYVQQNVYMADRDHDALALVTRFLEVEGVAKPEIIASELALSKTEVERALSKHPDRFTRDRDGWRLRSYGSPLADGEASRG